METGPRFTPGECRQIQVSYGSLMSSYTYKTPQICVWRHKTLSVVAQRTSMLGDSGWFNCWGLSTMYTVPDSGNSKKYEGKEEQRRMHAHLSGVYRQY